MDGSRGSALIIALLVTFILSLLGVSFLVMARTEGSIAYNERLGLQTLYMAEAGARAVGGWFDRPGSALGFPATSVVDRTQRLILDESDPYVNPPLGSAPMYKQGVDLDGVNGDDLFERPYRGDVTHTLLGLEVGPDMRIDDADPEARAFLVELSETLLGSSVMSPGRRLRLSRIDVYAPPYVRGGQEGSASWMRLGIATVAVTARLFRTDPAGNELPDALAERTVRWVINEITYRTPVFGPLHVCGDLTLDGDLPVHWGTVTVIGNVYGYDGTPGSENVPPSLPRAEQPSASRNDRLWAFDGACLDRFTQNVSPTSLVEDPWLRLFADGTIDDLVEPCATGGYGPWLCDPGATAPWPDGQWPCCNHCNKDQQNQYVQCPAGEAFTTTKPVYVYEYWKNVATSGGRNVYYLVPVEGTNTFVENGIGEARTFEEITGGRDGLFFFDTKDGLSPRDHDGDGTIDNLSDPITVSGAWHSAGYIFINTQRLTFGDLDGSANSLELRAPGEPFLDGDGDLVHDPGEAWVNLDYPTAADQPFRVDAADATSDEGPPGAVPVRNRRGPAIPANASFHGILLTTGELALEGSGLLYGSLIARGDVHVEGTGPDVYWSAELDEDWPPASMDLPRVTVTRWSEEPWGALP